jgi:DNA uptake protein ComE-like DNA-binding protein
MLKDFFYIRKSDRRAIIFVLCVILIALGVIIFTDGQMDSTPAYAPDSLKASHFYGHKKQQTYYYQTEGQTVERFAFDPNTADSTQLLRLGLQPWQVRSIYRYRARGGVFRSKRDFAQLYGLTKKDYLRLEPYIRISDDYQPASTLFSKEERDTLRYPAKLKDGDHVVLNTADTTQLMKVPGIGSYYAKEIIRHGKWIGGYVSVDQLDEIEGFPPTAKKYFVVSHPTPQRLNINKLTLQQLRRHPYINYYQAKAIVDYRRLYGDIKSLQDLRFSKAFPEDAIQHLEPYVEY